MNIKSYKDVAVLNGYVVQDAEEETGIWYYYKNTGSFGVGPYSTERECWEACCVDNKLTVEYVSADMREKLFENAPYGKVAMLKFGDVHEDFRIYCCGWLDDEHTVMRCSGAVFAEDNTGKLCVKIQGTEKSVLVQSGEM